MRAYVCACGCCRYWLGVYVTALVTDAQVERLSEVAFALIQWRPVGMGCGGSGAASSADCWDAEALGLDGKSLLRELLPLISRDRSECPSACAADPPR